MFFKKKEGAVASSFLYRNEFKHGFGVTFKDLKKENDYLREYKEGNQFYTQIAMVAGILIYAAFGIIDSTIAGDKIFYYHFIRFGIVTPVNFVIFLLSFNRITQRILPELFAFAITLAGVGVVVMSRLGNQPNVYLYDTGVLLVIMYGCILSRLRLLHTFFICGFIIMSYLIVDNLIIRTPGIISLHGIFNLVAGSIIGITGNYLIEKFSRNNYLQSKKIEYMAITDSLTGLFNRRKFELSLKEAINLTKRYQAETSLIYLDVDDFKHVNDGYGHDMGDELLIFLSDSIKNALRETDIAARMGGDEFAILLPHTNEKNAILIMQRILKSLKKVKLKGRFFSVGFSAGCTLIRENDDIDSALKRADDNLYKAKKGGKGQVLSN